MSFTKAKAKYIISANPALPTQFNELINYLKSSPLLADIHSKVLIEDNKIYLGHSFVEFIAALPPEICAKLKIRKIGFFEHHLNNISTLSVQSTAANSLIDQQQALIAQASQELKINAKPPVKLQSSNHAQPIDVLSEMLSKSDLICVGEVHTEKGAKKFLIDNLAQLKKAGLEIIYLEHVFTDTQQDLLDAYLDSKTPVEAMPIMLRDYLKLLDANFGLYTSKDNPNPYSFLGLVIQAKKLGIQIKAIDTTVSYSVDTTMSHNERNRYLMMNQTAKNIIAQNPGKKGLVFSGSGHTRSSSPTHVPGILDIFTGYNIAVTDSNNKHTEIANLLHPDAIWAVGAQVGDATNYQAISNDMIKVINYSSKPSAAARATNHHNPDPAKSTPEKIAPTPVKNSLTNSQLAVEAINTLSSAAPPDKKIIGRYLFTYRNDNSFINAVIAHKNDIIKLAEKDTYVAEMLFKAKVYSKNNFLTAVDTAKLLQAHANDSTFLKKLFTPFKILEYISIPELGVVNLPALAKQDIEAFRIIMLTSELKRYLGSKTAKTLYKHFQNTMPSVLSNMIELNRLPEFAEFRKDIPIQEKINTPLKPSVSLSQDKSSTDIISLIKAKLRL